MNPLLTTNNPSNSEVLNTDGSENMPFVDEERIMKGFEDKLIPIENDS